MKKTRKGNAELAGKMAAYAATALSALAVANPASAAIIYNGPHNVDVPVIGSVSINLDGDANDDFRFAVYSYNYTNSQLWKMSATGLNSAQFINARHGFYNSDVINLPAGYNIKGTLQHSGTRYWTSTSQTVAGSTVDGGSTGNFTNKPGYMGVRFHSEQCQGSDWNYGWVYLDANGSGSTFGSATIVDWAYESQCNTPIDAGAKASAGPVAPVKVPTLDQWGMLALTALLSGAAILRMKKEQDRA
ncbi:MAG: IPTL-CTERM sorting domain-containing protein [Nitrospiraceae bacterium]|nr:IPTL-CTERM sorting domain-containing protein [Nitrospiraceae bacterium]